MAGASAGSPTSRPKSPSATGAFGRRTEFANRDRRGACVDQPLRAFALSKSEVALSKREVWGVRCVGIPSTAVVPSLRYVRGQPSFDAGTNVVPALLGRDPDELENSEDCRSAGGHGNQHVRLRGASIDASTVCPAPATACCRGPGKLSYHPENAPLPASRCGILPKGQERLLKGRRKAIRFRVFSVQSAFKALPRLAAGRGIVLGYVLRRLCRTYRFNPMTR